MQFQYDSTYAQNIGGHFGKYIVTFISENAQVMAHLFEEEADQTFIAYVSFAPGVSGETVRDSYLSQLNEYATEHGFGGRLHLRYT